MARTCSCLYQGHLPEQLWSTNHPSMPLAPSPISEAPCPGGFVLLKLLSSPSRLPGVTPCSVASLGLCLHCLPASSPPGCSQELNPSTPDRRPSICIDGYSRNAHGRRRHP